ncbi:MAG: hypothetical protein KatS3mg003_1096 [Candidatus Nitrosocaldaceae archaeon]|nr:MAG: hypothetical protein KatS3mg003_1096 [Candidatus Nitrosocaldaceae archaeon]
MNNYILRIAKDEWIRLVFGKKVYYTAMRRRWKPSSKILFVKRMDRGDSLIGYGIIDDIIDLDDISGKERELCLNNGWIKKLIFSKMIKFEPPILIKDTEIAEWPQKGALLHGAPITDEQLEEVIKLSKVRIAH